MDEQNLYLSNFSQFEKEIGDQDQLFLKELRQSAIDRFAELGFPTLSDEEWRFTNLAPLLEVPFQLATLGRHGLTKARLREITLHADAGCCLVFVNGFFAAELSTLCPSLAGVTICSLAEALEQQPEVIEEHLARYANYEEHPFIALNTAFIRDGAFIHVAKGQVIREPIHLLFVNTSTEPSVSQPRNLIVLDVNSQATVLESYVGLNEDVYFNNIVTEVALSENAVLDHYKAEQESPRAFHLATLQIHQQRGSNFSSHYFGLGGRLTRHEANTRLDGEGCECTLNGLYMANGTQHLDNRTLIDHAMPHCASHELYKGILDGKAHGVFNGKIFVRPDAQKTDAKQTNQTLLLSDDAIINTKPQLEIYADDVKCTHGATVGQLSADGLFYLRSRGIGLEDTRRLLIYAFANDIVNRVRIEPIRRQLEELLLRRQQLGGREAL
ncbi:MAG: Fe-S cluster assembly protein SufD [Gemmataceae bacterium]